MTNKTMNDAASRSLGAANSYAVYTDKFDPTLINPMPRELARKDWGITGEEFYGADVWNCHEATFLVDNGLPLAGTLKFIYDCRSDYMIESKSAKLYMNSFDMCKMGPTIKDAIANYENQIREDMSKYLETDVQVKFFLPDDYHPVDSFGDKPFYNLLDHTEVEKEMFTDYTGEHHHLICKAGGKNQRGMTNILRSRCRHTKQKDTGSIYFDLKTDTHHIDELSLLKQIISMRELNEFHEFCCEKMFIDIANMYPSCDFEGWVGMLYSRRGSLDINPIRGSSLEVLRDLPILDIETVNTKVQGQ